MIISQKGMEGGWSSRSHGLALHRLALHRLSLHWVASRVALHRIASPRLALNDYYILLGGL